MNNCEIDVTRLLAALETTGIPFAVDAWVKAPGKTYGVVSVGGDQSTFWADDGCIWRAANVTVDLWCHDGDEQAAVSVTRALMEADFRWRRTDREYLSDPSCTHTTWLLSVEAV